MLALTVLIIVVILCLIFTYTNGFQDGSSVAASAIGCRALNPLQAVLLVATFEFLGALLGGSAVSDTIHSICSWPRQADLLPVLASGLLAAVIWNFFTRQLKLPTSSTHALVGGILGAVFAGSVNFSYIVWGQPDSIVHASGVWKVALSLMISPLVGFLAGFSILSTANFILMHATSRINRPIKSLQWFSVAALAFGHGANDSQKATGVLVLSLAALGLGHDHAVPWWARLATGTAMAVGVASLVPGIVRKVGSDIYKLRPVHGLTVQVSSASVLLLASLTGGPVSTTQVISSTVMGVGTADRIKGVHWLVVKDIILAWFLTIPCSALLAWLLYHLACRSLGLCL